MESMLGYPKEPLCTAIRRGLFLYYNKMICKCYNLCYNIYSEFVHILICTNFLYMGILCKQSAFFHVKNQEDKNEKKKNCSRVVCNSDKVSKLKLGKKYTMTAYQKKKVYAKKSFYAETKNIKVNAFTENDHIFSGYAPSKAYIVLKCSGKSYTTTSIVSGYW